MLNTMRAEENTGDARTNSPPFRSRIWPLRFQPGVLSQSSRLKTVVRGEWKGLEGNGTGRKDVLFPPALKSVNPAFRLLSGETSASGAVDAAWSTWSFSGCLKGGNPDAAGGSGRGFNTGGAVAWAPGPATLRDRNQFVIIPATTNRPRTDAAKTPKTIRFQGFKMLIRRSDDASPSPGIGGTISAAGSSKIVRGVPSM